LIGATGGLEVRKCPRLFIGVELDAPGLLHFVGMITVGRSWRSGR
jgi:hypothetical protein